MPDETVQQNKRIEGLDALRGVAILLVMTSHFLTQSFPALQKTFIYSFGGGGVLLFFYLSGFLIFKNVHVQPPVVFLERRFFKLFPAYWMNVVVISCLAIVMGIGVAPDFKTLIANFFMVQEWVHTPLLNNVYWTLQIEVKFYIIIVLFYRFFGERWIYALFVFLLATNAALWPFMHRGSTLLTYLATFFPGIAAARFVTHGGTRRAYTEMAVVTTVTAINLLIFLPDKGVSQSIYALIFSAALLAVLLWRFRVPVLSFFGKISYSLYLYHTAVGYALILAISKAGSFSVTLLACIIAFVVSIAISTASFYWLEKPGIAFGRRLETLGIGQ